MRLFFQKRTHYYLLYNISAQNHWFLANIIEIMRKAMVWLRNVKGPAQAGPFKSVLKLVLVRQCIYSLRIYLFKIPKSVELTLPSSFKSALSVLMLIPDLKT